MAEETPLTRWLDKVDQATVEIQNAEDEETLTRVLETLFDTKYHPHIASHLAFGESRTKIESTWHIAPTIGSKRKPATTGLLEAVVLNPLTPPTLLFGYEMRNQANLVMKNPMVPLYFESSNEELFKFLQACYRQDGAFFFRIQQEWMIKNYENNLLLDLFLEQISSEDTPAEVFQLPRLVKKNVRALDLNKADRDRWFKALKKWMLEFKDIYLRNMPAKSSDAWKDVVIHIYIYLTLSTAPDTKKKYHTRQMPLDMLISILFRMHKSNRFEDFFRYVTFMKKVSILMGQPMPWHPLAEILENP